MRKRPAAFVATVGASLLLLAACSSGGGNGTTASPTTATGGSSAAGGSSSTAQTSQKVIYLNPQASDPFWLASGAGAKAAAEASGAKYQELDANADASTQASQIETAISQRPTVLVVSPVDSKAVIPQLKAAMEAGIKVLAINRPISDLKLDGTATMSEKEGGAAAAKFMLARARAMNLTNLRVLQLRGAVTDEAAQLRGSGFAETIQAADSGIHVELVQKGTDWKPEKAASAAEDVLSTGDVQGIFVESDFLMPSLIPVLERHKYTPASGNKHAILVGVGGLPDALKLIKQGWQDGTMNFPIDRQAAVAVYMGVALVDGQSAQAAYEQAAKKAQLDPTTTTFGDDATLGPQVGMVPQLVTSENVADDSLWGNHAS